MLTDFTHVICFALSNTLVINNDDDDGDDGDDSDDVGDDVDDDDDDDDDGDVDDELWKMIGATSHHPE